MKIISDLIIKPTYDAQGSCEGYEYWPCQWDHACLCYGETPEMNFANYILVYYEEAVKSVQVREIKTLVNAVTYVLGTVAFSLIRRNGGKLHHCQYFK